MRKLILILLTVTLLSGCSYISSNTSYESIIDDALESDHSKGNNSGIGYVFYTPKNSAVEMKSEQSFHIKIGETVYVANVNIIQYLLDEGLIIENSRGRYIEVKVDEENSEEGTITEEVAEENTASNEENIDVIDDNSMLINDLRESEHIVYEFQYNENSFIFISQNGDYYNVIAINSFSSVHTTVSKDDLHHAIYYSTLIHDSVLVRENVSLAYITGSSMTIQNKDIISLNSNSQNANNSDFLSGYDESHSLDMDFNSIDSSSSATKDVWTFPSQIITDEELEALNNPEEEETEESSEEE